MNRIGIILSESDMAEEVDIETEIFQQFESFDFHNNTHFQDGWQSIRQILGDSVSTETLLNAQAFFFSRQVKPLDLRKYLLWKKQKNVKEDNKDTAPSENASGILDNDSNNASLGSVTSRIGTKSESEFSSSKHVTPSYLGVKTDAKSCAVVRESYEPQSSQDNLRSCTVTSNTITSADQDLKKGVESSSNNKFEALQAVTSKADFPPIGICNLKHSTDDTDISEPSLSLAEIAELIQNQQPIPGLMKLNVQPTNSSPTPSALAVKPKPWQTSQEGNITSLFDTS